MSDVGQTHLLVRAARGERVERPPVWAMRQAGRWDPEFNRVRNGLSFYEFSENVELAAQASLLPRRFGVDGIILFYDITTLPVAMGLPFALKAGEGPVPATPIRTQADLDRLTTEPAPESYGHIRALLRRVKEDLQGSLPVIVFAGAPFTVASYCIGTGKNIERTLRFAAEQPEVWRGLLQKLDNATIGFLRVLLDDGADLYQLFDSWAGMLNPVDYERWAHASHCRILTAVADKPRILFVKECPYLELMAKTGTDVISLGTRHDLAAALRSYPQLVFQGNVDQAILKTGTPEQVRAATRRCLEASGGQRHIVNLSHGVDKATPPANFEAYIDAVKSWSGQ